jgi:hypothetical protein
MASAPICGEPRSDELDRDWPKMTFLARFRPRFPLSKEAMWTWSVRSHRRHAVSGLLWWQLHGSMMEIPRRSLPVGMDGPRKFCDCSILQLINPDRCDRNRQNWQKRRRILGVVAPASPDAALANLAWTFVGSH